MNILLTNAGRRTYIVKALIELSNKIPDLNIFITDAGSESASFWVDKRIQKFITPYVSKNPETYVSKLLEICEGNSIDLLIPLIDTELPLLARSKEKFNNIDTEVLVSDIKVVETFYDKVLTQKFCKENNFGYPDIYISENSSSITFPVIIKKRFGSGSEGLLIIKTEKELEINLKNDLLIQEFIEGRELGLDILNDFDGNFIHCCVKEKLLMRAGETDKATIIHDSTLIDLAKKISSITRHIGNLDIDLLSDSKGNLFIIDLNPRFGGGFAFTLAYGFNYLEYLIRIKRGEKYSIPEKQIEMTFMKGIEVFGYER